VSSPPPYVSEMLRGCLIAFVLAACAAPACAADDSGTISIMRPEPHGPIKHTRTHRRMAHRHSIASKGFGVKENTRRGSSNPVYPAPLPGPQAPLPVPEMHVATPKSTQAPPLYVPQTGRTLPNLPSIGNGPGGTETLQDKSVRCAHQAGAYGASATGNPGAYIGSCINQ